MVCNATLLLGGSSLVDDKNNYCSVFTLGRADEVGNRVFGQGKETIFPRLMVSRLRFQRARTEKAQNHRLESLFVELKIMFGRNTSGHTKTRWA